jgi:hypothetical protein
MFVLGQAVAFINEQLFRLAENGFATYDRAEIFDKLIHCPNRVAGTGGSFNAKLSGPQITQISPMGKEKQKSNAKDGRPETCHVHHKGITSAEFPLCVIWVICGS